ncbi:hypothetical protein BGZ63DRAFT_413885 [Mariannaea sp. PMI_226]|nr:hypothetical protein BGZ63DRAFT_413885 [Mariannaea sp. PMI_226]
MASGSHAHGLEALITIKVQFEGLTRRTKMPLRDMVPRTLESNIRTFLHFPAEADMIMERYSDSAGAYVYLDPQDVPIYKQLYRAAKAKSKLKIRVSLREIPLKTTPKPVTVEDEPEATTMIPTRSPTETPSEEKASPSPQESQPSLGDVSPTPTPVEATTASTSSGSDTILNLPYRPCAPSASYQNVAAKPAHESCMPIEQYANYTDPTHSFAAYMTTRLGEFAESAKAYSKPVDNVWCPAPVPAVSFPTTCPATGTAFAVCCNGCDKTIPDIHYHCSTCDDGDFDLCQSCVDQGATCKGHDHWLIKRITVDGRLIQSTTDTVPPKMKIKAEVPKEEFKEETKSILKPVEPEVEVKIETHDEAPLLPQPIFEPLISRLASLGNTRTCNCCVQELPEREFLHCNTCEDYDLCQPCFSKNSHGHHPQHGFSPAVEGTEMPRQIELKMAPGRNQRHHAICDGCDKNISGVRHKCLDCPDWDYCSDCIKTSQTAHPDHRFVPVYEQLHAIRKRNSVHVGICCDGPLCAGKAAYPSYIHGTRYKCAICNDLDYCANCQASPSNSHNKTHPMIMFRTPVRAATIVTTEGERNGHPTRKLGDVAAIREAEVSQARANTINRVQTVLDVKPIDVVPEKFEPKLPKVQKKLQLKKHEAETKEVNKEKEVVIPSALQEFNPEQGLTATFVYDTIRDGTILPPNHVFEQTWILRNESKVSWPAGCSVKFVGGDYMGHVDSNHPAGISELVSASESTVCYTPLAPGQEFPFTVLLRTPSRAGNIVSYWRLTTPSGHKFGDRLWCDVSVRNVKLEVKPEVKPEPESEPETKVETPVEETKKAEDSQTSSQMIFPKLDKESPVASIHEAAVPEPTPVVEKVETKSMDEDWDLSEDGFMTDEEYDILDASDEEYLEDQKKLATK